MQSRRRSWQLVLAAASFVFTSAPAGADDYSLPLDSIHYNQYITAYYDNGGTTDWNCGSKTYSGHRGTDIGIGGFGPQAEGRPVLAAADGVVASTHDGEDDTCTTGSCGGSGGGYGNYVFIDHADGKRTVYGHLKRFSVLVEPGQSVACGQKLGEVGSSGNSTGPHLHFEGRAEATYASSTDPFEGPCSGPPNYWFDQGPYDDLPVLTCTDFVDPWPLIVLDAEVAEVGGVAPAGEEPRADVGEPIVQRFEVRNTSHPLAEGFASGLRVGIELDTPLRVTDWWVESSCEEGWCPSPAGDDPANPDPDAIAGSFALELGDLGPGAHARVSLALVGEADTGADAVYTRFHVSNVDGVYAKPSWDSAFEDHSGRQTWNDGDLRIDLAVSVDGIDVDEGDSDGSPPDGPGDGDTGSGLDSASGSDSGGGGAGALPETYGAHEGGCTCRSSPPTQALLLLLLLPFARRRGGRRAPA